MAVANKTRFKRIIASSGGTLQADPDRMILIRDIFCVASANDTYLTCTTDSMIAAKLHVKGMAGNHLPFPMVKTAQIYEQSRGTIMAQLRRAGRHALGIVGGENGGSIEDFVKNPYDIRFPVRPGGVFNVARYAEAGMVVLCYDEYDAADWKSDLPNAVGSPVKRILSRGTNVASTADGPMAVTTSLNPVGVSAWPFDGSTVPVNTSIKLLAIIANPIAKGAGAANKGYSTHLQLIERNNVLFDVDGNGIPFKGDTSGLSAAGYVAEASAVGPGTAENPAPPLVLEPPREFQTGDSLAVNVIIAGYAAGGPGAAELDLSLALEITNK